MATGVEAERERLAQERAERRAGSGAERERRRILTALREANAERIALRHARRGLGRMERGLVWALLLVATFLVALGLLHAWGFV